MKEPLTPRCSGMLAPILPRPRIPSPPSGVPVFGSPRPRMPHPPNPQNQQIQQQQ